MSVGFKSPLSSANTNAAFVSKIVDSTSVAKLTLNKPAEGAQVTSVQAAINKAFEGIGTTGEADTTINNYSSNNYIVDGDSRKVAIEKLDTQLGTTQTQLDAVDAANSQDITLLPVGSTPNANGASLSGQILNLQPADGTNGGVVSTTTQTFSGNKTFLDDVVIDGDLTVNGTTTTINSATVDSVDPNITLNKNGNDASSAGAGLTIDRTGTKGSFVYENALASRFKIGDLGSERQVADVSSTQTFTNKTLTSPSITTPTGIVKGDVGLGNVTNDSQLKRSANDFNTFTEKTTLVDDDVFIIEDSEASGAKKFVKKVNLGAGGGGVSYQYQTKTANYTILTTDTHIFGDATGGVFTLTFPAASTATNKIITCKKTDSSFNRITLSGTGMTTNYLMTVGEIASFMSDGTSWIQVYRKTDTDWIAYAPVNASLVGIADEGTFWRRTGDSIDIKSTHAYSTYISASFAHQIPGGGIWTISSTKSPSATNTNSVGLMYNPNSSGALMSLGQGAFPAFTDVAVDDTVIYMGRNTSGSRFAKTNSASELNGNRTRIECYGIAITDFSS